MRPFLTRSNILAVAAVAILVATAALAKSTALSQRASWPNAQERVVVPSPRTARLLAGGYNELFADLAWARTTVYYGDRLVRQLSLADVDILIELVNTLDPYFRRPYNWGAYATMFRAVDAKEGRWQLGTDDAAASIRILERAVKVFPEDHKFAWLLGIRYYMDLKNPDPKQKRRDRETGAAWIERAMRLPGAPTNLPSLAASLRTQLGQKDIARQQLGEMLLNATDPKVRAKLRSRYHMLTSKEEADAIEKVARAFFDEWIGQMGYAPPSLYILVGPPPPIAYDRNAVIESNTFVLKEPTPDADSANPAP